MLNQRLYSALNVLYGCKQLLDDLIKLALVADLTPMTWQIRMLLCVSRLFNSIVAFQDLLNI